MNLRSFSWSVTVSKNSLNLYEKLEFLVSIYIALYFFSLNCIWHCEVYLLLDLLGTHNKSLFDFSSLLEFLEEIWDINLTNQSIYNLISPANIATSLLNLNSRYVSETEALPSHTVSFSDASPISFSDCRIVWVSCQRMLGPGIRSYLLWSGKRGSIYSKVSDPLCHETLVLLPVQQLDPLFLSWASNPWSRLGAFFYPGDHYHLKKTDNLLLPFILMYGW